MKFSDHRRCLGWLRSEVAARDLAMPLNFYINFLPPLILRNVLIINHLESSFLLIRVLCQVSGKAGSIEPVVSSVLFKVSKASETPGWRVILIAILIAVSNSNDYSSSHP